MDFDIPVPMFFFSELHRPTKDLAGRPHISGPPKPEAEGRPFGPTFETDPIGNRLGSDDRSRYMSNMRLVVFCWWKYVIIYIYSYFSFRILDVRCKYAINFRDFQRWFLPRTVHVNVNMFWEMYVLFSPCCFVPRFSVFLWSLQIFMFAAVAVTSFCIHFRGSTYPPGHQIIEWQSAMIELQPLKHWTNHDYMWTIIILRWLDRITIKNNYSAIMWLIELHVGSCTLNVF